MENDFRLFWLETFINRSFNMVEETSMFNDLLLSEGGKYRRLLLKFVDGLLLNKVKATSSVPGGGEGNGQHNGSADSFGFPCLCFWTSTIDIQVEESPPLKDSPDSTSLIDKVADDHDDLKMNDDNDEENKDSAAEELESILGNQEEAIAESKIESPSGIDAGDNVCSSPSVVMSDLCIEGEDLESPQSAEDVEIQNITIKRKRYKHVLHLKDTTIAFDAYIEPSNLILRDVSVDEIGDKHLLFIVRSSHGPIPLPVSLDEAERVMEEHLEFHSVYNRNLNRSIVLQLLGKLFLPLIELEIRDDFLCHKNKDLTEVNVYQIMNLPHNDILTKQALLRDLREYLESETLDDHDNKIYFIVSEEVKEILSFDPNEISSNKSQLEAIENACKMWTDTIENAVAVTRAKLNSCVSPMEEVEFWILSSKYLWHILQNLNSNEILTIIKLLTSDNNRCVANFNFHKSELELLFLQAEDLSQYMNVLKPYFKVLHREDATLKDMDSLMPCLMLKLRLVWGISKYLSTAVFMGSLLQRIANQLAQRAIAIIDTTGLSSVCPNTIENCCENVKNAKQLMDNWKRCYLEMRTANDVSGPLPPWEFDRKRLFENTDYLSNACQNILDVFQILEQFDACHRLGLEAAFYEVEQIKSFYLKIKQLPVESFDLSFDPLQMTNGPEWKRTMELFRREVSSLDAEFLNILREGFGHIKSARAAIILISNFSTLHCRPSLKSFGKHVLKDVALKLIDEIEDTKLIFKKNQNGVFNYKNLPQVSSCLFWSQRLLDQVFQAVNSFRESEANESLKEEVRNKFENFQSEVVQFQNYKMEEWTKNAQSSVFILMGQNIFKRVDALQLESGKNFNYEVNYPKDLLTLFREARHLEELGFEISSEIHLIASGENVLINRLFTLNCILKNYQREINRTKAENKKTDGFINQLEQGCNWISWMSSVLARYIDNCKQMLNEADQ